MACVPSGSARVWVGGDEAPPRPAYAGLFVEPDIPPAEEDEQE